VARCRAATAFGQIGARGNFAVWNEFGQDAVKQIDVVGPEAGRPCRNNSLSRARPRRGVWDRQL